MKKYFFILAAAAALAACAKNEVTPVLSQENTEIAYNVAPKTKTLAANQENFATDNVFASWAFYLPKDQTWAANSATSQPYIVNSTISHKDGTWKDQNKSYYWPKDGGSLTFLAYSLNKGNLTLAGTDSHFNCTNTHGINGAIDLRPIRTPTSSLQKSPQTRQQMKTNMFSTEFLLFSSTNFPELLAQ